MTAREEGGVPFEELFAQAIIAPEAAERRASELADEIRRRAEEARAGSRLLNATEELNPSPFGELSEELYGIAYETTDGISGNDLIGTKAEAGAFLASIEAQRSAANEVVTPFPKGIAAS